MGTGSWNHSSTTSGAKAQWMSFPATVNLSFGPVAMRKVPGGQMSHYRPLFVVLAFSVSLRMIKFPRGGVLREEERETLKRCPLTLSAHGRGG